MNTMYRALYYKSEIITLINENCFKHLKHRPVRITAPDIPEPASYGLTKFYYHDSNRILNKSAEPVAISI